MRHSYLIAGMLVTMIAGCGPVEGGGDTGNGNDAGPTDTMLADDEPPELRDIQIDIQGESSSKVTLNTDGSTRILPVPAMAEFTVFARDNETDTENLQVRAVDAEGMALENDSSGVQNGLWRFATELSPDMTIRVEVTDAAGNTTTGEHSLRLLSREESLVGEWEKRFYDNEDQSITDTHQLSLKEDGTWLEQLDSYERGGDYRVEDGELIYQQTHQGGGSQADSDESTVESDRQGAFYVDDSFFSPRPWSREKEGSGAAGTWTRSATLYAHDGDGRTESAEVSENLKLESISGGDNSWTYSRTVTPSDGGDMQQTTRSGTWKTVEITTNYGKLYGTFLVRTTTREDGMELDSPRTQTELYRLTLDKLLISPYTRTSKVE